MKPQAAADNSRRLNVRLTAVSLLLVVSTVTNGVLATLAWSSRSVVLVPTLPEQVEVSNDGIVSREYMERVTRDVTYLMLNRTPDTMAYFSRQIERVSEPSTYQQIRKALAEAQEREGQTKTSQAFYPSEFFINTKDLYAEVRGTLDVSTGTDIIESRRKIYAVRFVRRGSMLRLSSFVEIKDPKDSKAETVQPTTEQEPQP